MNVKNLKDFIAVNIKTHSVVIMEETGWSSELLKVVLNSEESLSMDSTFLDTSTIRNLFDRLELEKAAEIYVNLSTLLGLPIGFIDGIVRLDRIVTPSSKAAAFMELSL